jgi:hypothetical protein
MTFLLVFDRERISQALSYRRGLEECTLKVGSPVIDVPRWRGQGVV